MVSLLGCKALVVRGLPCCAHCQASVPFTGGDSTGGKKNTASCRRTATEKRRRTAPHPPPPPRPAPRKRLFSGIHDSFVVSCRNKSGLHTKNNLVTNVHPFALRLPWCGGLSVCWKNRCYPNCLWGPAQLCWTCGLMERERAGLSPH